MRIPGNEGNPQVSGSGKAEAHPEASKIKASGVKRSEPQTAPAGGSASSDDSVKISGRAREIQLAHEAARAAPEVRSDKVAQLKKQVASGNFKVDSGAVAEKLLAEEFNIHPKL